jgi:hypothetical protein
MPGIEPVPSDTAENHRDKQKEQGGTPSAAASHPRALLHFGNKHAIR